MILALVLATALPLQAEVQKIKVNEIAPEFALPASNGKTVRLSDFKGKKKVVLAFFPKAFSGGCTREMAAFQAQIKDFEDLGTQVMGISLDSVETQTRFAESLKLSFPILSDKGGRIAKAYGVMGPLWPSRTNIVIDEQGMVIAVVEGKDALDPAMTIGYCRRRAS